MTSVKPYWQNYIDGSFCDGGTGRLRVDDPGTGLQLAEQALADEADVDRAVQAAKRVHLSGALSDMRPVERGRMVKAMGEYLLQNVDEIAHILSLEAGKPKWEAVIEVQGSARYFEYYGNQAETLEGRSIPLGSSYYDFTTYEPMGISAQIIPWNYPLEMTARSLSAALATGNTCVIKTPELDPLTNFYLAKAAEFAGFPAGTVNIFCGYGAQAGAALSAHPDINQVVFTGSVQTGIHIATAAAQNVVPCVLELGGKSAAIVCEDADVDAFMNDLRWGIYFNAGQVCSAMSRVIVHESQHEKLVEGAVELARSLSVGPGIDRTESGLNMGAMVSLGQRDRAAGMIGDAQAAGATVATGGRPMNRDGFFLEPTIMTGVTPDMTIANEEVFGPVTSIIKYKDEAEAQSIMNGTPYGLVGGVFTKDIDRAMRIAQKTRAGQIFVNEWFAGGVETPFGGYGKSGYGREKGREALWNYLQTKNIAIKLGAL
jgi:aldehyde dehydrogenase (NAD+)